MEGVLPEPSRLGRLVEVGGVVFLVAATFALPAAATAGEVANALDGDFRSFGLCSAFALFLVVMAGRSLWRLSVWEPPRYIRQFRYAGRVLACRTDLHGPLAVPLAEVAGVYRRVGKGESVDGWTVRRADGEWLLLTAATGNARELIDRMCEDGGWGEPPPSPV